MLLMLLGLPFVAYPVFLMNLFCLAIFAASFNLLLGSAGMLSFGHAAFFGGAAYLTGYLSKGPNYSAGVAIACGVGFAVALGGLFALLAIRRKGIYFSMITLALSQMFYFICLKSPLSGGEDGLQGIPRNSLLFGLVSLESDFTLYYLVLALLIASLWFLWRVVHSPFGQVLQAIRDNEARAISLGYSVERYKVGVFVLSAALAGLAGALHAVVVQVASLNGVSVHLSSEVILMVLLGGIGTTFGPLIGAGLFVSLQYFFASWELPIPVLSGLIFIVLVMAFPKGLVGELRARLFKKRVAP